VLTRASINARSSSGIDTLSVAMAIPPYWLSCFSIDIIRMAKFANKNIREIKPIQKGIRKQDPQTKKGPQKCEPF
jgi:hypothetical protein